MTPVALSRLLTLEARQDAPDGAGGYLKTWVSLGQVWADVQYRTGRDGERGEAAMGVSRCQIIVRAAPFGAVDRPKAGQRFRQGTQVFRIQAVGERGDDARYLTCSAIHEVAT